MKMLRKITAIFVAAAVLAGAVPVMAKIGGDERHTQIPGWTVRIRNADAGAYIDKSEGVLGNASLKLVNNTERWEVNQYVSAYYPVAMQAGKNYILEFECKTDNATLADAYMTTGNRISLVPGAASHDWMKFKTSYRPAANGNVDVGFVADNKCGGVWIDNVVCYEEKSPDVNLISNGDFENGEGPEEPKPAEEAAAAEAEAVKASNTKIDMYADVKEVTLDGKPDEWGGVPSYPLEARTPIIPDFLNDITGNIQFAYDEANLYFMLDVIDKYHYATETSSYWTNDGIQFGFGKFATSRSAYSERGAFLYDDGKGVWTNNSDFDIKIKREGDHTYYEGAVPFEKHFSGEIPDTIYFNMLVNNNDGMGRAYAMEITEGICNGKNPILFNYLHFRRDIDGVLYSASTPEITTEYGSETVINTVLVNTESTSKTVDVSVDEIGFEKSVSVPAGEEVVVNIPVKAEQKKDIALDVKLACGNETATKHIDVKVNVNYDYDMYLELKALTEERIAELKNLIGECEAKGLTLDYEVASYSLMCEFYEYMNNEVAHDYYESLFEYEKAFESAYNETKESLNAYLAGEKKPVIVPKYKTGDIRIEGSTIYGNVEIDGKIEERPIYFVGNGFWEAAMNAIPLFENAGFNKVFFDLSLEQIFCEVPSWERFNKLDRWVDYRVTDEEAYTGKHSFKATTSEGYKMNFYTNFRQKIKVKPNTTYKYGAMAKASGLDETETGSAYIGLRGANPNYRGQIKNSADWQKYEFEYTTGPDETEFEFSVVVQNNANSLYVDDIFLMEKGTDVNLVKNSSFEQDTDKNSEFDQVAKELGVFINYNNLEILEDLMARAETHNLQLDISLSAHHMPDWMRKWYPDVNDAGKLFLPFPLDHIQMRKAIGVLASVIGEMAKKYKSVQAVCITNEPVLNTNEHEYYLPHWHKYLKNLYDNDINKLNEQYGLSGDEAYKTFDEIEMPLGLQGTPVFNDYRNFNDETLLEFHSWYIDEIKKVNPDLLCYTKIMQYFRPNYTSYFMKGTNYEQHAFIQDVNGCDGWNPYGMDMNPFSSKMGFYDMMRSIREAPVFDGEDHILPDAADVAHDDMEKYYVDATIWDGTIHGRGTSIIWVWDYRNRVMDWWPSAAVANSNLVQKPGVAFEVSKTVMDISRLSREITAVKDSPKKVGLLYSRIGVTYNGGYTLAACNAYEEAIFNGTKVHFVTDSRPEDMHDYELLIVPEATNIPSSMLEELRRYAENGGEILVLGEKKSFEFNEYNKPHNAETVDYIYSKADAQSSVSEKIRSMELSELILVDTETGEQVEGVEWAIGEYNGKIIANVLNYSNSDRKTVKLVYKGEDVNSFTELRKSKEYNGQITLEPLVPVLLQF